MLNKLKTPLGAVVGVALIASAFFIFKVQSLNSNLKANTNITQNLKHQLDLVVKEEEDTKQKLKDSQTQVDALNSTLKTLQAEKTSSGQKQEELQKLIDDSDKTLKRQNQKLNELEKKLKDAQVKLNKQKKQNADLEGNRNPSSTGDYAKLMENEWLAAVAKTAELKKDLDKTLSEVSAQNREKGKLQKEAATMHYNLAVILTNQHNYPAAIREYEKVIELDPNDADAHYNLAIVYDTDMKDNDKALEQYREYIRIAPDSKEAQEVREWIHGKELQNGLRFEKA
jgi:tetratricopeptide (TPR) repeat protein